MVMGEKSEKPPEVRYQLSVGELADELENLPDDMGVFLKIDGEIAYLACVGESSRGVELYR